MPLRLYDTWSRAVREFTPIHPDQVGLYCCGPTVYDHAHIGNLRTYVFEDVLRRALVLNGYNVRHVVNITDVGHLVSDADEGEDKMEKGSRRTGESAWAIAERYTAAFMNDWRALNLLEPALWCRATDHIAEQIDFIAELEHNGYTYRTADGVYFDTGKQDDYGYLARLDVAGLQAGKRVASARSSSATDFALWKFSPPGATRQMEWDSPWGRGFPGWHIECSAMSAKYLGPWFDIHCGGEDHISVHHSNEIAQMPGDAMERASRTSGCTAISVARRRREDVEVGRRVSPSAGLDRPRHRSARLSLLVPDARTIAPNCDSAVRRLARTAALDRLRRAYVQMAGGRARRMRRSWLDSRPRSITI